MIGPCWLWPRALNDSGYGVVRVPGKRGQPGAFARSHRLVYESVRGPVADGMVLDHLCRNRACCNPWHLEPVTRKVNVRRGAATCTCKRTAGGVRVYRLGACLRHAP